LTIDTTAFNVAGNTIINGTFSVGSSAITIGGNLTGSGNTLQGVNPVLNVSGYIGSVSAPLVVSLTGTLTISAGGMQDMVSVALKGTGNYSWQGAIPGFVFINGGLLGQVGQQNFRSSLIQAESGFYAGGQWGRERLLKIYLLAE
jgi:hypothetical protein